MTAAGVLLFVRKVRESTNTHEPWLDLSTLIDIMIVCMKIILVCAVFCFLFFFF